MGVCINHFSGKKLSEKEFAEKNRGEKMKNFWKNSLVVVLVLALGVLMLPTIALADEASGGLLAEVQADIDAVLEDYYIEPGMT